MANKKWIVGLILILTLLGMGISLYLTRLHYVLMLPGAETQSICNINATINCDVASASPYSEIAGVPVAGIGFLYFAVSFLFSLWGAWVCRSHVKAGILETPPCNPVFFYLFLFTIPALLMVAYMAYASLHLSVLCLFCVGMYVLIALLFFLFLRAANVPWKGLGAFLEAYLLSPGHFIKTAVLTLVLLGIGWGILAKVSQSYAQKRAQMIEWQNRRDRDMGDALHSEENLREILAIYSKQPVVELPIPDNRPRWGSKDAPLQFVEFIDFQCPACRQAAQRLPEFLSAHYAGKFSIVQLHFPLDQTCNPNIKRKMHPFACEAAKSAVCAGKLSDNYWEYSEMAFENQQQINSAQLRTWAAQMGIESAELDRCVAASEMSDWIAGDIELATQVPVEGTPTILLNGRNIQSVWRDDVIFKRVLDEELKKAEQ